MIQRRRNSQGSRSSRQRAGDYPQVQRIGAKLLLLAAEVRGHGDLGGTSLKRPGTGECRAKEDRGGPDPGQPDVTGYKCKKMVSLAVRRTMTEYLISEYGVSERHAYRVMILPRSTHHSQPDQARQIELTAGIIRLPHQYVRFGYHKVHTLLVTAGWRVSRETVRLIRKYEGLRVRKNSTKSGCWGKARPRCRRRNTRNMSGAMTSCLTSQAIAVPCST